MFSGGTGAFAEAVTGRCTLGSIKYVRAREENIMRV